VNEINTYRNKHIILVSSLESSSPSKTEYQEIIDYVFTNGLKSQRMMLIMIIVQFLLIITIN